MVLPELITRMEIEIFWLVGSSRMEKVAIHLSRRMQTDQKRLPIKEVFFWLGVEDSNLGLRFQRPLSYH